MAKPKTLKLPAEEVLKHYVPCSEPPALSQAGADVKAIVDKTAASNPIFVKATLAVDHVMSNRRSAVIENPMQKTRRK